MKIKDYTESNRKAWNAVMPFHQQAKKAQWDEAFQKPGYIIQTEPELSALQKIGIRGKKIIHLCCNNGRELLSLKNMGADYCLGVDISDAAVAAAISRAKKCNIDVEYLRSDVYELGEEWFCKFDLVYMTIGGLVWLPDIKKLFYLINRLLKPEGDFFIYDSHPFTNTLPWGDESEGRAELVHPYFYRDAWKWQESMDYYGGAEYDAPVHYEFTYTMSDIIMAMIDNGLTITHLSEYEHDISNGLMWLEHLKLKLPLSYIMTGTKCKEITDENRTNRPERSENCKICP